MRPRHRPHSARKQRGLTLVELLVALSTGLLVVLVAAASLLVGQQGFRSVDATTELRDRERFAIELVSRLILQAGFQDFGASSISLRSAAQFLGNDPEPDIYGWNNAVYKKPDDLLLSASTKIVNGNRPGACSVTDTSCKNGSDILVVRFQGVNSSTNPANPDNTMINCMGQGEAGLTGGDLNDRALSMFHVTRGSNGEPALSCSYYNFQTGNWASPAPMIEGVESFQLLFGTDGVTPSTAPGAAGDTVAERWLRADQLTVAGNTAATRENWRRVRAVRVGLLIRGAAGSAPQSIATTWAPLGTLYASADDTGSSLTVSSDGRLRVQTAFTVHLRNDLSLR